MRERLSVVWCMCVCFLYECVFECMVCVCVRESVCVFQCVFE